MLLTPVGRLRIHSQYANVLQEVPLLEINPKDAQKLSISNKEHVNIKNNRDLLR